jgi:hypothetical protein
MTVAELISKLQSMDPNALVLHRGYEDGYDAASDDGPWEATAYRRINGEWYNGAFEVKTDPSKWSEWEHKQYDAQNPIAAVII